MLSLLAREYEWELMPLALDQRKLTRRYPRSREQNAVPQWMGESQGFRDGDELVVWTKNIIQNSGGHGLPEHSDKLQLIERSSESATRFSPT